MIQSIPEPAIQRLSVIYQYLCRLTQEGTTHVSSAEIADYMGARAHTVRKDISYLKQARPGGSKYTVEQLKHVIGESLHFNRDRNACVVGLGRIGRAVLQYNAFAENGFIMKAGFDANINVVETVKASCNLYPSYQIEERIRELSIELAVLAVPSDAAQKSCSRLVTGGVKGIVNFSSRTLSTPQDVHVIDIDVTREFRILSAMISLNSMNNGCDQNER